MSHRLYSPGHVLAYDAPDACHVGYVMQDGDCPYTNTRLWDWCSDDGQPESGSVCGYGDGHRICCATGAYTAWFRTGETTQVPVSLCTGHTELVRTHPDLVRVHTVRAHGVTGAWSLDRRGEVAA